METIRRSLAEITALAGSARDLVVETSAVAEIHINNLREQVDTLWKMAGDMLPTVTSSEILDIDRLLGEMRIWRELGLVAEITT